MLKMNRVSIIVATSERFDGFCDVIPASEGADTQPDPEVDREETITRVNVPCAE